MTTQLIAWTMPGVPLFRRRSFNPPLLFLLALVLFLPLLGRRDIVTSHEARVAQTAREMAASGWPWAARAVDVAPIELRRNAEGVMQVEPRYDLPPKRVNPWIVPVMNGEIRLKKPPLPYWGAAVLFKLAGGESERLARLVPAVLGALATLLVADLAGLLIGARARWIAAAVWLSSYFVFDEYRKAMADPYLAFFTLACAWAWVRASQGNGGREWRVEESTESKSTSSAIRYPLSSIPAFYLSLALGFLAKGPLILIPLGACLVAYHALYRRPMSRGIGPHLLGLLLFAAITLPWPVVVWRTFPNALELWGYESGGGLTDTIEHVRPWWFYASALPAVALPWTAALVVSSVLWLFCRPRDPSATGAGFSVGPVERSGGSVAEVRRPCSRRFTARQRRQLFPIIWLLADVLAFSLSSQKKNVYLLPVAPAMTLAVTHALLAVLARARLGRTKGWPGALVSLQVGIGLVAGAMLTGAAVWGRPSHATGGVAWAGLALVATFAPLFVPSRPRTQLVATVVGYAVATFVFVNIYYADNENARSPKRFAQSASKLLGGPGANVFTPNLPPEAGYYLPLGIRYDPSAPVVYVVVDDRHKASGGGVRFFEERLERRVASVERVIDGVPNDPRWRLYRVHVAPMVAEAIR